MATVLTAFGETKTVLQWSRDSLCRVTLMTLLNRVRMGWSPERAITEISLARTDLHKVVVSAFGDKKCLTEWKDDPRVTVPIETAASRLSQGWEPEKALTAKE